MERPAPPERTRQACPHPAPSPVLRPLPGLPLPRCPRGKLSSFSPAQAALPPRGFPPRPLPLPSEQWGAKPPQHLSYSRLAPPGQEPSQGRSYLGEDPVHVSSSQLPALVSGHWGGCVELRSGSLPCHQGRPGGGRAGGPPGHTLPVGRPFPGSLPGGGRGGRAPLLPSLAISQAHGQAPRSLNPHSQPTA